jgi:tetratricopeptide (TPR) repeat protein
MELTIDQALQQGIAAHKEGKLQDAERLYRAILKSQPNHPDANHNLGVLAVAVGKPLESMPLFKLALEANPKIEQFWLSYVDVLMRLEHFDEAKRVLVEAEQSGVSSDKLNALNQKLLVSVPNDTNKTADGQTLTEEREAQGLSSSAAPSQDQLNHLLGHFQAGRLEEAEELATLLTQQFPNHPFAWKVLGAVLQQTGRVNESLLSMQQSVGLSPQDAEAHSNLGVTLKELGRLDDAEASYREAIALKPDYAEAHSNLGVALKELGRLDDAEASYRKAIALKPDNAGAQYNLGNTLKELSRLDDAEASYREAIALKPDYAQAHYNLGITLQELGKLDGAEASYRKAIALTPDHAEAHSNLGVTLQELGRLDDAEASYRKVLALKPDYAEAHNNLGVTLKELGRLDDAEASYREAIALKPGYAEAHSNLGVTLKELGRLDDAEASYKEALALEPDYAEAHYNLGVTLQELGKLDDAEASYRQAIALKPDYAEAHSNLGSTLKGVGRLDDAEASYREAIALKPDFAGAHSNLGVTLEELGRLDDAEASHRKAIALKPDFAGAHSNLGNTLRELGRLDGAEASHRRAIALKPDFAEAQYNLGNTLLELGRLDEAEASYRQAIAADPDFAKAHHNLAIRKKFSSKDEQFSQMQALYRDPATSEKSRCHICFALAKAYEDLGEFARAFRLYAEGNALRKKELGYNKAQDKQLFESLKANGQQITYAVAPEIVAPECAPIFIVGMPRSGTTLVEQIISSHPLVTGAGELSFASQFGSSLAVGQAPVNAEALKTFREEYLNALKRCSEGNAVVTDKMPHNFRFLGLIFAALPEAKIIHVKRDPAAVCWANYTQYFVNDSLGYCYSLDDTLHYYELYQDLMEHWRLELPNRIYDLHYEVLTENQEEETRKLIAHLGLEWDDTCLSPQDNTRSVATASNVQVRQRVYQGSSEKWKRYEPYLNGALDSLGVDNQ